MSSRDYLGAPPVRGWSRIGMAGFAFFLVKGILWLVAPVLLAVLR
jgi:hypothetical protein